MGSFHFELYPALFLSLLLNGLKKIGKYWLRTPLCPLSQIRVSHISKTWNSVVCGVLIYSIYCTLPAWDDSLTDQNFQHWTFALPLRTGLIILVYWCTVEWKVGGKVLVAKVGSVRQGWGCSVLDAVPVGSGWLTTVSGWVLLSWVLIGRFIKEWAKCCP